ncbi:biotin/lipoate A/B protein ligase [Thermocrinis albus DSM 14484]|uniref:Biotin/lipoate A/B protein ligase n=1 Tax=Thermocrinis albus (strain DSM 14484 / JCM 11386 / HI 11/12) TaxID=638303 RepID=D3SLU9_THEAH|nr:biotin/lipoate A/B protein ligase family protein [Thermocrinis albus]ADC89729.1 biotin/lipoate A/B protein ligase [Thermocrinis albus DSM 14484]
MSIKLYLLGRKRGFLPITLMHAMARLGYTGVILVEPEDLFLCLGYFDYLPQIVDLRECRNLKIPIIRREIGGGTVLLGPGQVFYQMVLEKRDVPFKVEDAYKKLSSPVVRAYRRLGVDVEYRPINDIVVKGSQRKISGQGAGDVGKCFVFAGNILVDFNVDIMARLLAVVHKDKVREKLLENMSWLKRETGTDYTFEDIASLLVEEFSREWDLEPTEVPQEALDLAHQLERELTSEETLWEETGRKHNVVKIREGVYIRSKEVQIEGSSVKVYAEIVDGVVRYIELEPPDHHLEKQLTGIPYELNVEKEGIPKHLLRVLLFE